MDMNATLIGQIITFAIFVLITMKFVWPPLMRVLEDRRKRIADGLAAAEQGERELELAQHKVKEQMLEAKTQAAYIIEQANHRSNHIIEQAKQQARGEGDRLLKLAQESISQEYNSARERLLGEVSQYAVAGAKKILQREVNRGNHKNLVDELVDEI